MCGVNSPTRSKLESRIINQFFASRFSKFASEYFCREKNYFEQKPNSR